MFSRFAGLTVSHTLIRLVIRQDNLWYASILSHITIPSDVMVSALLVDPLDLSKRIFKLQNFAGNKILWLAVWVNSSDLSINLLNQCFEAQTVELLLLLSDSRPISSICLLRRITNKTQTFNLFFSFFSSEVITIRNFRIEETSYPY